MVSANTQFQSICFPTLSTKVELFPFQVHYYVQSHIQINEYRDRKILVSIELNAPIFYVNMCSSSYVCSHHTQPMLTKKFGRPITTCIKVLDMTGLKLSAMGQMKVHIISIFSSIFFFRQQVMAVQLYYMTICLWT